MKFTDQMRASRALGARDYPTVIRHYEVELEGNPKDLMALYMLSVAYEGLKQSDVALDYITRALAEEPNNFQLLMIAARHWYKKNPHITYEYVTRITENPPKPMPRFVRILGTMVEAFVRIVKPSRSKRNRMKTYEENEQKDLRWAQEYRKWYQSVHGVSDDPTLH